MRQRTLHIGLWSGFLMMLILACGGFVIGKATPTPLLWPNPGPETPYRPGLPPTVTPTPAITQVPASTSGTTQPATEALAIPTVTPQPPLEPPVTRAAPTSTPLPTIMLPPTDTPRTALRPGPQLVAYALRQTVWIDGQSDDWPANLPWYTINQITYGPAYYHGPTDLSGRLRVAWDDHALYLFWEVTDDVFVQTQQGPFFYQGDSVEILVDADLAVDFYVQDLNFDDYQIGFSPGNPPGQGAEAWLWYPLSLAGPVPGTQVAAQATPTGYTVEVRLPWHRLSLRPYPGLDVGFAASISDNDRPGSAVQQTMASTSPFRRLTDPTTWGELLLVSRAP